MIYLRGTHIVVLACRARARNIAAKRLASTANAAAMAEILGFDPSLSRSSTETPASRSRAASAPEDEQPPLAPTSDEASHSVRSRSTEGNLTHSGSTGEEAVGVKTKKRDKKKKGGDVRIAAEGGEEDKSQSRPPDANDPVLAEIASTLAAPIQIPGGAAEERKRKKKAKTLAVEKEPGDASIMMDVDASQRKRKKRRKE